MSREVLITGMGMVTALGADVEDSWRRALAGDSGIRGISSFKADVMPVAGAGEVEDSELESLRGRLPANLAVEQERRVLFALDASRSALADAGLVPGESDPARSGVVMGTGLSTYRLEDFAALIPSGCGFNAARLAAELEKTHPGGYFQNPPERATSLISKWAKFSGPSATLTSACAAAGQAIGFGMRMIRRGEADLVLCGGADSMINPVGMAIFLLLGVASTAALCRPFDQRRSGLVVGEGAGVLVLESAEQAVRRGARAHARLLGYGSSMDAYRVTAPDPSGQGAARSMRGALRDAGLVPEEIAYVNAHGTGTRLNDPAETLAIQKVFGESAALLAVSSTKPLIGHLIAACGAPELIFTALSVARDEVHPTLNLEISNPGCNLDYVPGEARKMEVPAAISNSFGFGGQNATLVVGKAA